MQSASTTVGAGPRRSPLLAAAGLLIAPAAFALVVLMPGEPPPTPSMVAAVPVPLVLAPDDRVTADTPARLLPPVPAPDPADPPRPAGTVTTVAPEDAKSPPPPPAAAAAPSPAAAAAPSPEPAARRPGDGADVEPESTLAVTSFETVSARPAPGSGDPFDGWLIERIRAQLKGLPCSRLAVEPREDHVAIVGSIGGDSERAEMARRIDRITPDLPDPAGLEIDLATTPPSLCGVLSVLSDWPPVGATALTLRTVNGTTRLNAGDPLILELDAPDYPAHLQVDYFTVDGTVIHLFPNPLEPDGRVEAGATRRLGEKRAGGRFWSIGPPFGPELLVAIATPDPLFAARRPEAEASAAYTRALEAALRGAKSPVLVTSLLIRTSPR